MLVWPTAGAVFGTYNVFQTSGLDYRLVALGGLMPLLVDLGWGRQLVGHSLLAPTVLLVAIMAATAGRGRRLLRRRLIGLPIGWYAGLVLFGAWRSGEVFFWPAFGSSVEYVPLLGPLPLVLLLELIGALALRWIWVRFGLADPRRRHAFLRTGRLDLAAP